ncbi:hypothetical protein ACE10Z_15195 [Bradyrhizobium sp. Pha-3]|uniref:hypothetical protein n=1 Tax=Bradyrhizobium sp. Pha-3 TaxID=208375 RepID=UPI0035D4BF13
MNLLEQLDEVFRETIDESDVEIRRRKFNEFTNRMEAQVARLPPEDQRGAMEPVVQQMAVYWGLMQHDKEDLRVRLGLRGPSAAINRLGQLAAESALPKMDLLPQVDHLWREILGRDRSFVKARLIEFNNSVQAQVSHLPKAEQERLLALVYMKNEEYGHEALRDRSGLIARMGVSSSSPSVSTNRLAQVAAETVVRATIWESVIALFRAFR